MTNSPQENSPFTTEVDVVGVHSLPALMVPGILYVPVDGPSVMLCPCGCGDRIELPGEEALTVDDGKPSFASVIRRDTGCRSYFSLKNGVISWLDPT